MARLRVGTVVLGLFLCGALSPRAPAMVATGTIEGTVTNDSVSHDPIQGVHVCYAHPELFEEICSDTDGAGHYALTGLDSGSYKIFFRAPAGQNYTRQYFDDVQSFEEADPVVVGSGATVSGIDAELHGGGTITGTATQAGSGNPIQGLSVCASASTASGEYIDCSATGSGGQYTITGLPADPEYEVEFSASPFAEPPLNYLTQYYDGKEELGKWDPVSVAVGATTTGIDVVMNPGAQISGKVTEDETGDPWSAEIEVCAEDPGESLRAQEFERCAFTDASGEYTIRSLRAGTFVVGFDRPRFLFNSSRLFAQWYDDASSEAQATRITIAPPQTRTGVDAHLLGFLHPKPPGVVVTPIKVPTQRPKQLKCKKHFHRRKVKGKVRCVKAHRKHHPRHHHR